jgi:hypothetical protein
MTTHAMMTIRDRSTRPDRLLERRCIPEHTRPPRAAERATLLADADELAARGADHRALSSTHGAAGYGSRAARGERHRALRRRALPAVARDGTRPRAGCRS